VEICMYLALAYFDSFVGPEIFYAVQSPLPKPYETALKRLVDTSVRSQIFEYIMTDEHVKIIHFPFQVRSDWGRGQAESLLIAIILEKDIRSELFSPVLRELAEKIMLIPDNFKAFHKVKRLKDPRVIEKGEAIQKLLKEYYARIQGVLEQSAIGNILFLGLNNVGKTTILEWLRSQKYTLDIKPTLAVSVIELLLENYRLKAIDVSGQKRLRKTWWSFTQNPDAIIFVVDLLEPPERMEETRLEFDGIMTHFLPDASHPLKSLTPVLICGNKLDLVENASIDPINKLLNPKKYKINYQLQLTSAKTGAGIIEGFKWLMRELLKVA
jgi:small GTP-binding protein